MCTQVVIWNSDARLKPDLEVEIEIVEAVLEVPGFHFARFAPELEVALEIMGELEDAWFVTDDELVALDEYTVYDAKPHGYSTAYRLAI